MLFIFAGIAVLLTVAMFFTRQSMLSFPSCIFWILLAADAYVDSVYNWDIYYLLFFASAGMCIFCILAGFGLREKKDTETDEDEYIDEQRHTQKFFDETQKQADKAEGISGDDFPDDTNIDQPSQPSRRTIELRKRAKERKTGDARRRTRWGGFR